MFNSFLIILNTSDKDTKLGNRYNKIILGKHVK